MPACGRRQSIVVTLARKAGIFCAALHFQTAIPQFLFHWHETRLWAYRLSYLGHSFSRTESELMLVLTRRPKQSIQIGNQITINVIKVTGNRVQLGIEAPRGISIMRSELLDKPECDRPFGPATGSSCPADLSSTSHATDVPLSLQVEVYDCPLQQFLFAP